MSESQEQFETLRQLLALKRHEVPPPGYHRDLSHRIARRVRAIEQDAAGQNDPKDYLRRISPWLFRLIEFSYARPSLVGFSSLGVFLALAVGAILLNRPDDRPTEDASPLVAQASGGTEALAVPQQTLAAADFMTASSNSSATAETETTNSSLSLQPVGSFLGGSGSLAQPVPVSFNGN